MDRACGHSRDSSVEDFRRPVPGKDRYNKAVR